jgi:hypothetical protein
VLLRPLQTGLVGQRLSSFGANHRITVFGGGSSFVMLNAVLGMLNAPTDEVFEVRTLDLRVGKTTRETVPDLGALSSFSMVTTGTHAITFGG